MRARLFSHVVVVFGAIGLAACARSPTQPSAGLSQTDITNVSAAIAPAVSLALSKAASSVSGLGVRRGGSGDGAQPDETGFFSGSTACPDSGTLGVTGTVANTLNESGTGAANLSAQIASSSCRSSGILLQGSPSLSFSGQFTYSNASLASPATFTLNGGVTFTLNNVTGTATFSCSDSVNVNTFAVAETGTVTFEYPQGQNAVTVSCSQFD